MTMLHNHRVTAVLSTVFLLCTPMARAATVEDARINTPYVFETVDSYEIRGDPDGSSSVSYIVVAGVLKGESTVRTLRFAAYAATERFVQSERCDRLALLSMTKAGRYYFQIERPSSSSSSSVFCKLERR